MLVSYAMFECCEVGEYCVTVEGKGIGTHQETIVYQTCKEHLAECLAGRTDDLNRLDIFEVTSVTVELSAVGYEAHEAARQEQRDRFSASIRGRNYLD